jgi:hypothetical protein
LLYSFHINRIYQNAQIFNFYPLKGLLVQTTTKRLSIRSVALMFGLPPRVVSRAISFGELPAVITTTETGRERAYVAEEDAAAWFKSLTSSTEEVS